MKRPIARLGEGLRLRRPALATVATAPTPAAPRPARATTTRRRRRLPSAPTTWLIVGLAAVAYLPLLAHPAGLGQRRHQDVPVPRPLAAHEPGLVDVGPVDRARAPSPTRTSATCGRWGPGSGPSTASGCPTGPPSGCGGARSSSPPGPGVAYLLRTLGGGRGPGVIAATFGYALTPLPAHAGGPAVGHPAAVRGAPLADRPHHPHLPHPGLALPRAVRAGGGHLRQRQRHRPAAGRASPRSCGWPTPCGWRTRSRSARPSAPACASASLTVPVSAWWIAGLSVQGTNGIEILRYTETGRTVAAVSVSHEVLRGLGYWFFYGGDSLGPWIEPSVQYTQSCWLLAFTYLIPIAGAPRRRDRPLAPPRLLRGAAGRRRRRWPWAPTRGTGGSPLPGHQGVRPVRRRPGDARLPRAVPLVVLGAGGAGRRRRHQPLPALAPDRPAAHPGVVLAAPARHPAAVARATSCPTTCGGPRTSPPTGRGGRPPRRRGHGTRVLVVPGTDFATYRWGNTVDPMLPGLMDRPSVPRELIPYGSAASANLLNAFDLRLQERTARPCRPRPPRPAHACRRRRRPERPAVRAVQHAPAPQLLGLRDAGQRAGGPDHVRHRRPQCDRPRRPARRRAAAGKSGFAWRSARSARRFWGS